MRFAVPLSPLPWWSKEDEIEFRRMFPVKCIAEGCYNGPDNGYALYRVNEVDEPFEGKCREHFPYFSLLETIVADIAEAFCCMVDIVDTGETFKAILRAMTGNTED